MSENYDFGKESEEKVVEFLKNKGYLILHRNWRYQKAEIDIIAKKSNLIIIVEVKSRKNLLKLPEESVTYSKKKLLLMASNEYMQKNNLDFEVRFDIVSVIKQKSDWKINHIKDAFNVIF